MLPVHVVVRLQSVCDRQDQVVREQVADDDRADRLRIEFGRWRLVRQFITENARIQNVPNATDWPIWGRISAHP